LFLFINKKQKENIYKKRANKKKPNPNPNPNPTKENI